MDYKQIISETASKLLSEQFELTKNESTTPFPKAENIVSIVGKLRTAMFPSYFGNMPTSATASFWLQSLLDEIHRELAQEIETALLIIAADNCAYLAGEISSKLLAKLADLQRLLYKDAQAGFDGDPAAQSVDEVILTYPGFFAVFVYRVAHFLYTEKVPLIPRMMSEYAHSITGIDIHPGAEIGEDFFIDHGTGVVIGETAIIGNRVKIYQGVTLGAMSTQKGQGLKNVKRHPNIQDNVTIYSGASILGGDTVIGEGVVVGGNAFILKSVPARTVVRALNPELQFNDGGEIKNLEFQQPDVWFYEI
ncbi:MAG: serine acetyltransferase [Oscillospiraceae bacterium]|nr:serine acetyltransferase [Oscillospiraceae bacterium]